MSLVRPLPACDRELRELPVGACGAVLRRVFGELPEVLRPPEASGPRVGRSVYGAMYGVFFMVICMVV